MIPRLCGLATLIVTCATGPSFAATDLDRLESAIESMTATMLDLQIAAAPELGPLRPDLSWDSDLRTGGRCFIDRVEAEKGAGFVEQYIGAIEEWSTQEIASFWDFMQDSPEITQDTAVLTATQACGTMEIVQTRMRDSGWMDQMMDPDTLQKFMPRDMD